MPDSSCIKCGNTKFELKLNSVQGSEFKLYFVQCTSCGGVVGTHEYIHIGHQIEGVNKKINEIDLKYNAIVQKLLN